jgi:spermidine synthase
VLWLFLLFAGSGCAALIYEVVWFQLLELVIGSTGVSLGILLATFMGGMCLGSVLLPRYVRAARHPLRVYAVIEALIGVFGVVVLVAVPLAGQWYAARAGAGFGGLLMRGLISAACLVPPTALMGASLPAIARWVRATPRGVGRLGLLYASNIAGAVAGCLLAGFYLLRVHDMVTASLVAVAINVAGAAIAWRLAAFMPPEGRREAGTGEPSAGVPRHSWAVFVAIGLSGLAALGAEVVWTRLLSLLLGATTYSFSIILAVVLAGLGLGSAAGAWLARRLSHPRLALAAAQWLLPAGIAWSAYQLTQALPYASVGAVVSHGPWIGFLVDFARSFAALVPASLLWGASFPLALAAVASAGQDPGRLVGRVYAANTLGAIGGALFFSLLLIPAVGSEQSQRVLVACAFAAGGLALVPAGLRSRGARRRPWFLGATVAGGVGLATAGALVIGPLPPGLIAFGSTLAIQQELPKFLYVGEGINTSVAVCEYPYGLRTFHVCGKIEASSEPGDMRLQRLLGHLPALVSGHPKSVLVVGFGAGVTAGSFVPYPEVERIVICEIESLIPAHVGPLFRKQNDDVLQDPRVQVVHDDARHFILTTPEQFDVITSDPIHPWVKGSATLYTKEYLALAREHLRPGGVMVEWVPLYESPLAAVKSEMATFFSVFPEGSAWTHNVRRLGDDVVLLGQAGPTRIDVRALNARFDSPPYARVRASLAEIGIRSTVALFSGYLGRRDSLAPWLQGARINTDRNLCLQYIAGLGHTVNKTAEIYHDINPYRRVPAGLFLADDRWMDALRDAVASAWVPVEHPGG